MMSHSAIVCRDDRPGRSQAASFSGDGWLDYVPVRVPDTVCVQERLPPGAAAVLINRAHTDTDIYLPIDAVGKRLVDAIDGERSIGEIAGDTPREACRALFERLWWHDQVVFDGSRRSSTAMRWSAGPADRNPRRTNVSYRRKREYHHAKPPGADGAAPVAIVATAAPSPREGGLLVRPGGRRFPWPASNRPVDRTLTFPLKRLL